VHKPLKRRSVGSWPVWRGDSTPVGDVTSNKVGSGARANGGKLPLDLVPVAVWRTVWKLKLYSHTNIDRIMIALELWQGGTTESLDQLMVGQDLSGAVAVLEYGAGKYAAWNWAKGMAWSVPLGCCLRHIQAILDGEAVDMESQQLHIDHVYCNIIMLQYFAANYPAGDDRPIFVSCDAE